MLPDAREIHHPGHWPGGEVGVLNAWHFVRDDDTNPDALPHNWRVTSDAIAARVAEIDGLARLVLLKSVDLQEGLSWREAAERGLVDPMFGEIVERAKLSVQWVNFRCYLDETCAAAAAG